MPGEPIISVRDLKKSYGPVEAVRGIDFEVQAGEVFGLLGPNGAGKTTTVEILEGLRPRTGGDALDYTIVFRHPCLRVRCRALCPVSRTIAHARKRP